LKEEELLHHQQVQMSDKRKDESGKTCIAHNSHTEPRALQLEESEMLIQRNMSLPLDHYSY
jgi:hypothetical protein